jgi:nitrate/nitrite transporter NarK
MSVGAVIASGLTVRLLGPLGWRGTFALYAAVGVAWTVLFLLGFRNRPEEHPGVNDAERRLIQGKPRTSPGDPDFEPAAPPTDDEAPTLTVLGRMARSVSLWALCIQGFFRAFGYALYITWFPAYLEKGYRVRLEDAGDLSMLPLGGVVAGSFLGGPLIDAILARTGSRWLSRSGVSAAALGLCALTTYLATLMTNPVAAVVVIAVGALLSGLAGPTTWAATMDLCGRHTALGFAIMNMTGNLGAIACPITVGYLIEHIGSTGGKWEWVLYLFSGIYLAGAVSWLALDPCRSAVARTPKTMSSS